MLKRRIFKSNFLVGRVTNDYATIIMKYDEEMEIDDFYDYIIKEGKNNESEKINRFFKNSVIGDVRNISREQATKIYANSNVQQQDYAIKFMPFEDVDNGVKFLNPIFGFYDMRKSLGNTCLYEDVTMINNDIFSKFKTPNVLIYRDYNMTNYKITEEFDLDLFKILDYVRN